MRMQSAMTMSPLRCATLTLACAALLCLQIGCSSDEAPDLQQEQATPPTRDELDAQTQSLLVRGQEAYRRGNFARALAFLDSAETREPNAPVIPYNRGRVYTGMNQFEAARQSYRTALDMDPRYPEVRLQLAKLSFQDGNVRDALRLYRGEEQLAPSAPLYVAMGQAYAELGRADSARWAYARAVARDSTNARAHLLYGQFLAETGELETALQHSRQAVTLEPNQPDHQFAVGSQLYQLGRLEEAERHLRRAAEARLLHYPAQYTLGQVLLRLDRAAEARHYLARADSARRLMDQITAAQDAVSRQPNSMDTWIQLGVLFRKAGEHNQAIQAFDSALSIEPRNLTVHNHLGEIMLAEGRTEEAIKRFQAILTADRTRLDAWVNLGRAFAQADDCERAVLSWQTALKHHPGDPVATQHLNESCQNTAP